MGGSTCRSGSTQSKNLLWVGLKWEKALGKAEVFSSRSNKSKNLLLFGLKWEKALGKAEVFSGDANPIQIDLRLEKLGPQTAGEPPPPSLHTFSHGEGFLTLLQRLTNDGFYVLDEPEAALSPQRQLAALTIIDDLVKGGAQFVIATHSPILLAYPGAKIWVCDGSGISATAYEDTEHVAVTRDFLNHYPRRLQQLLGGAEDDE